MRVFLTFLVLVFSSFSLSAQTSFNPQAEGERLERLWWDQQKNQDIAGLTKLMSPAFQSINSKGAQDLAFNLAIIKAEKLGKYELTNIKVTQSQDNLIVTYQIAVPENYLGQKMSSKLHYRLDVWTKTTMGWQIIAHANLNPT
ncbi:MAG: nuclear transport factor 2 family protein [Betaproteobacteria bacterium]|nr:nuclear transport factor 2 family protein [Betaproteobacteria bacterium]